MNTVRSMLLLATLIPAVAAAQALKPATRLESLPGSRMENLEDPPVLTPMTPRDAVQTPKADTKAASKEPAERELVKIDEVIEKDHRTGLRVTARNGVTYTLTDPINEGATRKSDGTPMSGKTALPTWQVLKW